MRKLATKPLKDMTREEFRAHNALRTRLFRQDHPDYEKGRKRKSPKMLRLLRQAAALASVK